MNIREIYLDIRKKTGIDFNAISEIMGYPSSTIEKTVMQYTKTRNDELIFKLNLTMNSIYKSIDEEPPFDTKETNHYHDLSKQERLLKINEEDKKIVDSVEKLIKQKKIKNVKS